jgi:hypothetical protein
MTSGSRYIAHVAYSLQWVTYAWMTSFAAVNSFRMRSPKELGVRILTECGESVNESLFKLVTFSGKNFIKLLAHLPKG